MVCGEIETPGQKFEYLRSLGQAMRDGTYAHGETREVTIPKPKGGTRVIHIPDLCDRIVQRGIVQVVQPLIEPLFVEHSYGFRTGRSRFDALAMACRLAAEGCTVWLTEDVRDAFGSLPFTRSLQVFRRYTVNDKLTALVRAAMAGRKARGVIQGGPLSPFLLNLYLHHVLDRRWDAANAMPPLLRYADDILIPCRSAIEAQAARTRLHDTLIPAGMALKPAAPSAAIIDLAAGGRADWLGFSIGCDARCLTFHIPERSWARLEMNLSNPTIPGEKVKQNVLAWLRQMGPAYASERRDDCFARLFKLSARAGVSLRGHAEFLKQEWRKAWRRWRRISKTVPCEN